MFVVPLFPIEATELVSQEQAEQQLVVLEVFEARAIALQLDQRLASHMV